MTGVSSNMNMSSTNEAGNEVSPPPLQRQRRALVVVDVVESVRLMQQHEDDVIDRWRRFVNDVRQQVLPPCEGRMVKSLGDGMLLEFRTVPQAVGASQALQRLALQLNEGVAPGARIQLRAGLHIADVVIDEIDIFGAGVNLAARLTSLARPGELVLSAAARDALPPALLPALEDLGACYLKHLDTPVRAWRLRSPDTPEAAVLPQAADPGMAVAVLPLRPRRAVRLHRLAGDLLADEIVASLSRSPCLTVISRLSSGAALLRGEGLRAQGERLGAAYLVDGEFDCDGRTLVLDLAMWHAPAASLLWRSHWRVRMDEVLAGEDALVPAAVARICQTLMQRELQGSRSAPLPNLQAHSLLLSGIGLIHRSAASDFVRARELLEQLAERQGRRPHAHAWLGKWHVLRAVQGLSVDPRDDGLRALSCASRALEADPGSALALAMKGHVQGFLLQDLPSAEQWLAQAVAANPNEPLAWIYLAVLRAWQDRGGEGLPLARRALALSPLDPLRYYYDTLFAFVALSADEHALALDAAERSLQAHRLHLSTHRTLAIAAWHLGQHDRARAVVAEMLRIDPGFTASRYRQRYPGGDGERAQANAEVLRACGVPA